MRQFELRRTYRDKDVIAFVLQYPDSVHISLYGGDLPHIGAVGIIDPDGNYTVTQFPSHKEGIVCKKWIAALFTAGYYPAVVEVGIHYDDLDKASIRAVLTLTNKLLKETLIVLSQSHHTL